MDENEVRSIEMEAGINGSMEPIISIDNTRNTKRQDKKNNGSDEEEACDHGISGSDRAEEEKVDSDDDGKEVQDEENEGVSVDGVGGEGKRMKWGLVEDGEEDGDGGEKGNERVEEKVNGR